MDTQETYSDGCKFKGAKVGEFWHVGCFCEGQALQFSNGAPSFEIGRARLLDWLSSKAGKNKRAKILGEQKKHLRRVY